MPDCPLSGMSCIIQFRSSVAGSALCSRTCYRLLEAYRLFFRSKFLTYRIRERLSHGWIGWGKYHQELLHNGSSFVSVRCHPSASHNRTASSEGPLLPPTSKVMGRVNEILLLLLLRLLRAAHPCSLILARSTSRRLAVASRSKEAYSFLGLETLDHVPGSQDTAIQVVRPPYSVESVAQAEGRTGFVGEIAIAFLEAEGRS
jgi:hypothetical protein